MSFLKLFTEKYIKSDDKEWELAMWGYFPLADWVLREFEKDVPIAFRTSSIKALKDLEKHQGRKKQFPTFTKGSKGIANGAILKTEILVQLSGKTVLESPLDISTIVDRNGKRWLSTNSFEVLRNKFAIPMLNKIDEYIKMDIVSLKSSKNPFLRGEARAKIIRKFSNKEKKDFIGWYYKTSKSLITKSLIKDLIDAANDVYSGDYYNDEILIHDYKIEKIFVVEDKFKRDYEVLLMKIRDGMEPQSKLISWNDFLKKQLKNVNYCGIISKKDIETIDVSKNKYPKCKDL